MHERNKNYHALVMKAFGDIQTQQREFLALIQTTASLEELAEIAYTLSEAEKMLHELHKQAKASEEICEKVLCLLWAKQNDGDPVRTPYCTVTPRIKMAATLPKKGTEEYETLLVGMNFPKDMIAIDAVRPHWPGFVDYISEQLAAGKPLPAGLSMDRTYPVYGLTIRRNKGITE